MDSQPSRKTTLRWGAFTLVIAVLLRVALWSSYQPVRYSDTGAYRRLAASVANGFQRYDGTRTPGYPTFLALIGEDDNAVWLAQMVLGTGTTLLFFTLGMLISQRAWFGSLVGLAHTFNLGQLFFEANLITESLATFWVLLTLTGTVWWLKRPARRSWSLAFLLGLSASLATLTRPLFIILPAWTLLFLALTFQERRMKISWAHTAFFIAPVILLLVGWMGFINQRFNVWSMTTLTGYHLIQHSGHYFELVPDKYAALRDTYLEFRTAQIASQGTQTNAIWEAIPAMQKASGLSFYDLSRRLTSISISLIREHPELYLRNVLKGWWFFWRAPVYWRAEALQNPTLVPTVTVLVLIERGILFACNLIFMVTSPLALICPRLRNIWRLSRSHFYLAGTVWAASVLQTLLDHGDNPRFLVPLQSIVVFWIIWIGYLSFLWFTNKRRVRFSGVEA